MEDVHQLKVFMALAQNLSFTRAADSLFLTQSAVSHQIANLEKTLGTALVYRQGKTLSLTPAGQTLAHHAKRVFQALEEAEAAVRQAARPDQGRLRIGASATACQYLMPQALREFRECFPSYSLSMIPGDTPAVVEKLLDQSIDLGVLIRSDRKLKLQYHDLFTDELGFVVSPLHPWAAAAKIDRRQLAGQRMVLYSRHSATFRLVERFFARMGAPLRDWIELGSMEAIKELVKLGLGVSVMAKWIALPEITKQSLVWLPTPGAKLKRSWCIAATAGRPLSMAEQTLIGLCQSAASQLMQE